MTTKQKTRVAKARDASNSTGRQARCVLFSRPLSMLPRPYHSIDRCSSGRHPQRVKSRCGLVEHSTRYHHRLSSPTFTECTSSILLACLIGLITIARTETRGCACTRTRLFWVDSHLLHSSGSLVSCIFPSPSPGMITELTLPFCKMHLVAWRCLMLYTAFSPKLY